MSGRIDYAYDVFVSYSDLDQVWVHDELCPRLDAAGVDYLDPLKFVPGRPKVQEIERAVSDSRWTLLVLSDSYLQDHWRTFDNLLVQNFGLEAAEWRAIPAIKGPCELPPRLRGLVSLDLQTSDDLAWKRLIGHLLEQSAGGGDEPQTDRTSKRTNPPNVDCTALGLRALPELMRVPEAHDAVVAELRDVVVEFRVDFKAACQQIDLLANYKELHDQLHDLQRVYDCIVREHRGFLEDERALEMLARYEADLQEIINNLRDVIREAPFPPTEMDWIKILIQARAALHSALAEVEDSPDEATSQLRSAIGLLSRVLDLRPTQINTRMDATAGALRLPELVNTMRRVRDSLTGLDLDEALVRQFKVGVNHLVRLNRSLAVLRNDHTQWQEVDSELRRIEKNLDQVMLELEASWPYVKALTGPLCDRVTEDWAIQLKADAATLDTALTTQVPAIVKRNFISYRRKAGERFFRIDKSMKSLCEDLRSVGSPLARALETMS